MARGQLVGQRAAPPSVLEKMVLAQKTPVTLGSMAVGSTITLNVDGASREWIVVHRGKPSSIYSSAFTGGTVLMLKHIYESRTWHSANTNDYANSTIHSYLNSTFLGLLDADVQAAIKQVKIPYRPGSGTGSTINSGESGLAAKVWLASGYEVGFTTGDSSYFPIDGAKFDYFLSGTTTNAKNKRIGTKDTGGVAAWWLRSPIRSAQSPGEAYNVSTSGTYSTSVCSASNYIRPCLVLPDSFILSEPVTLTDLRGEPLNIPGAQIAAGSYTGTGQYGTGNPNALTLGFAPKLVIITCRAEESYGGFGWVSGTPKGKTAVIGNTLYKANITWRPDGLSWYADGDSQQLNQSGLLYDYIALG